ncbi:AMP-binding protein [Alcaligenaceae bacterium]|nr:AMP-binding protein [Alcaligenaceae bacterium]
MITDRLYLHAERQAEKTFVVYGTTEISYGDMALLVSEFAEKLHARGVAPGSHVALLCGNRPEFLVAWFAINELGAVAVPLNVSLVGEGLRYTLSQSAASVLLVDPELYAEKRDTIDALETPIPKIMIEPGMLELPSTQRSRWKQAGEVDPLMASAILYTSGTTGLPKGVVLPHRAYDAAGIDMAEALGVTADDRIMVFLPLFHANPQMYAVMSALQAGATLILIPQFSASRFFEDARLYKATGFTFVGTVLSILVKRHAGAQHEHGLKWCVGGGAPERVWRDVQSRFGVRVHELYGMTETGGWVTMNTNEATRIGSVGPPRNGVKISIRSETGQPLTVREKGEITAQAAQEGIFFSKYWNNPEATSAVLKDGWLYTGDRGWLDEDGYLYFDGRVKELIRRGGEMIAPTEIEQQLLKHEGVKDCAVVGVPDDIMGEEVKVFVVTDREIDPQALKSFLTDRIPAYMIPRFFSFVEGIPKTETQKIKRHDLHSLTSHTIDTISNA